jgi:hypothetical protein
MKDLFLKYRDIILFFVLVAAFFLTCIGFVQTVQMKRNLDRLENTNAELIYELNQENEFSRMKESGGIER